MADCPDTLVASIIQLERQSFQYVTTTEELNRWEEIMAGVVGIDLNVLGAEGQYTHTFTFLGDRENDTDVNPSGLEAIDGRVALPQVFMFEPATLKPVTTPEEFEHWQAQLLDKLGLKAFADEATSCTNTTCPPAPGEPGYLDDDIGND